jgi:class 3 adenylate cyclase
VLPEEQGEGDSVVAAFTRPADALAAALAAQRRIAAETPLGVRMAIHTGEAQLRDERNYSGNAVNRCARLRVLAHGGQTLVSRSTYELAVDELPDASIGPARGAECKLAAVGSRSAATTAAQSRHRGDELAADVVERRRC